MDPAFALLGNQSYHLTCALNPDGEATGRGTPWTPWRAEHPARCLPRARPPATTLPLTSESPDLGAGTAPRMFRKTETRHPVVLFKFPTQICEQIASPLFSALMLRVQAQVTKPHALGKVHRPTPQTCQESVLSSWSGFSGSEERRAEFKPQTSCWEPSRRSLCPRFLGPQGSFSEHPGLRDPP